jgi:hypothetical protein
MSDGEDLTVQNGKSGSMGLRRILRKAKNEIRRWSNSHQRTEHDVSSANEENIEIV